MAPFSLGSTPTLTTAPTELPSALPVSVGGSFATAHRASDERHKKTQTSFMSDNSGRNVIYDNTANIFYFHVIYENAFVPVASCRIRYQKHELIKSPLCRLETSVYSSAVWISSCRGGVSVADRQHPPNSRITPEFLSILFYEAKFIKSNYTAPHPNGIKQLAIWLKTNSRTGKQQNITWQQLKQKTFLNHNPEKLPGRNSKQGNEALIPIFSPYS